jgi:hypothetical protein
MMSELVEHLEETTIAAVLSMVKVFARRRQKQRIYLHLSLKSRFKSRGRESASKTVSRRDYFYLTTDIRQHKGRALSVLTVVRER